MSRNAAALQKVQLDNDAGQARCRNQGVVLDVPLEPVVQENEVMHTSGDAGTRKVGPKVMAEKVAGSGVFFRAFVKGSKSDRVLLFFPEDTDPCILEWVYKVSSRIYRANASAKSTWKYQGNGAWKLTEKSKKKPKSCKRSKAALNQPAGSDCAAAATPPSPEYDDEDEPCTKKHSRNGQVPQEEGVAMGSSIDSPWVETPISRWFRCHMQAQNAKAARAQASADILGSAGNPPQNSTPQGSADDACHSTQHVDEVMLSVDSADQHYRDHSVRLSSTGLQDTERGGHLGQQSDHLGDQGDHLAGHACQLRFERDFEEDGSNSDAMPQNSPTASGCEPAQGNVQPVAGKRCDSTWSQEVLKGDAAATGSPSNASGGDEQICFKTAKYLRLPTTASVSDISCAAFQSCT